MLAASSIIVVKRSFGFIAHTQPVYLCPNVPRKRICYPSKTRFNFAKSQLYANNDENEDSSKSDPKNVQHDKNFLNNLNTKKKSKQESDEKISGFSLEKRKLFIPNPTDRIQDVQLLLFDVFLLLNLTLSASFWVVYRLDVAKTMTVALNEGCIFVICWIISGVLNDAFRIKVSSLRDSDEKVSPELKTAINTFMLASVLRLGLALLAWATSPASMDGLQFGNDTVGIMSMVEQAHQTASSTFASNSDITSFLGIRDGQSAKLIPLEFGVGAILMTTWRMVHSQFKKN